ncbi:MAG TPA: hypothetical protein DGR97_09745 [Gammaproteobacteria bacterium]|nr:hypothetical protein [Gammaproteobacteria bacterium]
MTYHKTFTKEETLWRFYSLIWRKNTNQNFDSALHLLRQKPMVEQKIHFRMDENVQLSSFSSRDKVCKEVETMLKMRAP